MKILLPDNPSADQIRETLITLGYETTAQHQDDFDYVLLGNNPAAGFRLYNLIKMSAPDHPCLSGIDIELFLKKGIRDRVAAAGLNAVMSFETVSMDTINEFSSIPFIIKPDIGVRHSHKLNCTYKIYPNSGVFLSSVDPTELEELLAHGDDYVIMKSLAANDGTIHQLFAGCFVNSTSNVFINHVSSVYMEFDPRQEETRQEYGDQVARQQYINNFIRREESYGDANDRSNDEHGFKAQIQALVTHCGLKNTPFMIQALVDPTDSTKSYITDFSYVLRTFDMPYADRHAFIKDKLDFTYNNTDVAILDNLHYKYVTQDLGNGINDELKSYCLDKKIQLVEVFGPPGKLRKNTTFLLTGLTEDGVEQELVDLKTFLASDTYLNSTAY